MLTVSTVRVSSSFRNLKDNLEELTHSAESAIGLGADVVVLPELATSGYVFDCRAEAAGRALKPNHAVFDTWTRMASSSGAILVIGFLEEGANGELHDSAAIVDATGVRGIYRKVHLWDREKEIFSPGAKLPPVVETRHGRVSVIICFDSAFPEWTRLVGLMGTELLAIPTSWPLVRRPEGERPPEVQGIMVAARQNRMAVVCADRQGQERGVEWTDGSVLVNLGWVVGSPGTGVISWSGRVNLEETRNMAVSPLSDFFSDRRPDLYENLSRLT